MKAPVYTCNVTILDDEQKPWIVKNVFEMRTIMRALYNVVNDQATISDSKVVNDFRKDAKIAKLVSHKVLFRMLNGAIDVAIVDVKVA